MEYTKASSTFAEKRESSNLSEGTNISGLIDGDTIIDYQDDFILVREFVGSYLIVHKECFTSDDIYAPVSKYLGKVQCANRS